MASWFILVCSFLFLFLFYVILFILYYLFTLHSRGLSTARMDGADLLYANYYHYFLLLLIIMYRHFGVATHYIHSSKVPATENEIIQLNNANDLDVKRLLDSHSSSPTSTLFSSFSFLYLPLIIILKKMPAQ